ncbi:MAG: HIT domain-containing protein [Phycisphaerales bacterium]|nr:HIT domain-containing protein [Phycisphaerales bacterium]
MDQPPPAPSGPNLPPAGPPALQAPWRIGYLEDESAAHSAPPPSGSGSFLRDYWLNPAGDESNLVIVRTGEGLILLNRYPYANGHLLVALGEPRPTLMDYDPAQRAALWRLVDLASELMQAALNPQGINIGVNQGRAAGAGVPQHLHAHLVPRWSGDVNFMAVVGQVRVIPAALEHAARRYRATWALMRERAG